MPREILRLAGSFANQSLQNLSLDPSMTAAPRRSGTENRKAASEGMI